MSVDFSNVKIGDRIKLTNTQGDEHVFEVSKHDHRGTYLEDRHACYYFCEDWDTLEILEKPLPANENAMIGHPTHRHWVPYILQSGEWLQPGHGGTSGEDHVRAMMREEGFEVLYEGIPADA